MLDMGYELGHEAGENTASGIRDSQLAGKGDEPTKDPEIQGSKLSAIMEKLWREWVCGSSWGINSGGGVSKTGHFHVDVEGHMLVLGQRQEGEAHLRHSAEQVPAPILFRSPFCLVPGTCCSAIMS